MDRSMEEEIDEQYPQNDADSWASAEKIDIDTIDAEGNGGGVRQRQRTRSTLSDDWDADAIDAVKLDMARTSPDKEEYADSFDEEADEQEEGGDAEDIVDRSTDHFSVHEVQQDEPSFSEEDVIEASSQDTGDDRSVQSKGSLKSLDLSAPLGKEQWVQRLTQLQQTAKTSSSRSGQSKPRQKTRRFSPPRIPVYPRQSKPAEKSRPDTVPSKPSLASVASRITAAKRFRPSSAPQRMHEAVVTDNKPTNDGEANQPVVASSKGTKVVPMAIKKHSVMASKSLASMVAPKLPKLSLNSKVERSVDIGKQGVPRTARAVTDVEEPTNDDKEDMEQDDSMPAFVEMEEAMGDERFIAEQEDVEPAVTEEEEPANKPDNKPDKAVLEPLSSSSNKKETKAKAKSVQPRIDSLVQPAADDKASKKAFVGVGLGSGSLEEERKQQQARDRKLKSDFERTERQLAAEAKKQEELKLAATCPDPDAEPDQDEDRPSPVPVRVDSQTNRGVKGVVKKKQGVRSQSIGVELPCELIQRQKAITQAEVAATANLFSLVPVEVKRRQVIPVYMRDMESMKQELRALITQVRQLMAQQKALRAFVQRANDESTQKELKAEDLSSKKAVVNLGPLHYRTAYAFPSRPAPVHTLHSEYTVTMKSATAPAAVPVEADQNRVNEELSAPQQALLDRVMDAIQGQGLTVEDVFNTLDMNGDGQLTVDEIREGLELSELALEPSEAKQLIQILDSDKSGSVSLEEFTSKIKFQSSGSHLNRPAVDSSSALQPLPTRPAGSVEDPLVIEERILDLRFRGNYLESANMALETQRREVEREAETVRKQLKKMEEKLYGPVRKVRVDSAVVEGEVRAWSQQLLEADEELQRIKLEHALKVDAIRSEHARLEQSVAQRSAEVVRLRSDQQQLEIESRRHESRANRLKALKVSSTEKAKDLNQRYESDYEQIRQLEAVRAEVTAHRKSVQWQNQKEDRAAVMLQAAARGHLAKKNTATARKLHRAAKVVQNSYRVFVRRRLDRAATAIQAGFRGHRERRQANQQREIIQSQKRCENENRAAVVIQKNIRRRLALDETVRMRRSICLMQAMIRFRSLKRANKEAQRLLQAQKEEETARQRFLAKRQQQKTQDPAAPKPAGPLLSGPLASTSTNPSAVETVAKAAPSSKPAVLPTVPDVSVVPVVPVEKDMCVDCQKRRAVRVCLDCDNDRYCVDCFTQVHDKGSRRTHSYRDFPAARKVDKTVVKDVVADGRSRVDPLLVSLTRKLKSTSTTTI
eukprot:GILJ01010335.1.p1 GENE.GILJ01010335.1~~GILJ01010335.1.p1  ORF type:complete len:1269 (-),score=263.46 GILJ01010335.1:27-3833(-)